MRCGSVLATSMVVTVAAGSMLPMTLQAVPSFVLEKICCV